LHERSGLRPQPRITTTLFTNEEAMREMKKAGEVTHQAPK
jgi:hypothetical protein